MDFSAILIHVLVLIVILFVANILEKNNLFISVRVYGCAILGGKLFPQNIVQS